MIRAAAVTISDKGYRGARKDASGPLLCYLLAEVGAPVVATRLIPDEQAQIATPLAEPAYGGDVDLIVTTIARNRGTGPTPPNVTPEATRTIIEREMPGWQSLFAGTATAEFRSRCSGGEWPASGAVH